MERPDPGLPDESLREALDALLELPPGERSSEYHALLERDPKLAARLSTWLELEERAASEGFLDRPLPRDAAWTRPGPIPLGPGARVEDLRIEGVIGYGATSVVYLARQEEPRRDVALKVFQRSLGDREASLRFQAEFHWLGRLDHPGIAAVYGAGTHHEGKQSWPWIAMEWVEGGRPLGAYADENSLDGEARLELALQAARAVAHGHERGVVHRDLKDANLLVDRRGRVRVIDFGVAKDTGRNVHAPWRTETGAVIGTLATLGPEVLTGGAGAADTRIDVYALGVVFHTLFAGRPPYSLEGLPIVAAVQKIRDTPIPPLGILPGLGRRRSLDLDAVLRKCLEKNPARRYGHAGELAAELESIARHRPVNAHREAGTYRLRHWIHRHRRLLGGTLVAVAVLAWIWIGSLRSARAIREREAQRSEELTSFLESVLALASLSEARGPTLELRDVLESASGRIETELADNPDAQLRVHAAVGSAWRELGDYPRAEGHLRASVRLARRAEDPIQLACTLSTLSEVLLANESIEEAEDALLEARDLYRVAQAPAFFVGITSNKLSSVARERGNPERALELADSAFERFAEAFGEDHVSVATARCQRGRAYSDLGRHDLAVAELQSALATTRRLEGEGGYTLAEAHLDLAEILGAAGRASEAERELGHAREQLGSESGRGLGPAHPFHRRAERLEASLQAARLTEVSVQ